MDDDAELENVKLMNFANGEQVIARGKYGHGISVIYDDVPPPQVVLLELTKEQADVLEEQAKVNEINFDTIMENVENMIKTPIQIDSSDTEIANV